MRCVRPAAACVELARGVTVFRAAVPNVTPMRMGRCQISSLCASSAKTHLHVREE